LRLRSFSIPAAGFAAGILLLALALRLLGLQGQSFSMDELAELAIARLPPAEIVRVADGFPPLYHLLLHAWLTIFQSDASARWLSAILGTAAVWVVGRIGSEAGGQTVGLWTALLVATSPFQIWHSQEARAYALYDLLAAGALWAWFRVLRTDLPSAWIGYVATAWAGLLTHYHFAILLLVNLVLLGTERDVRPNRRVVLAHGALALLSLPVLWLLRGDMSAERSAPFATSFHPAAAGYTLFSFLSGYALGPSPRELHGMAAREALLAALPWVLLSGASAAILLLRGLQTLGTRLWSCRLIVTTLLPIVLLVAVAGLAGVTFQVRHLLWAAIPLLVVLGAGCSTHPGRPAVGAAVLTLLALFAISRYHRLALPQYQNEDVRALAAYLRPTDPSIPVLVLSGYMADPVRYYLPDSWNVVALPEPSADTGLGPTLGKIDSTAPRGKRFWLAYTREFHGDPGGRLIDSLVRLRDLHLRREFPGVRLYAGEWGATSQ
jgi:hypothetical protein